MKKISYYIMGAKKNVVSIKVDIFIITKKQWVWVRLCWYPSNKKHTFKYVRPLPLAHYSHLRTNSGYILPVLLTFRSLQSFIISIGFLIYGLWTIVQTPTHTTLLQRNNCLHKNLSELHSESWFGFTYQYRGHYSLGLLPKTFLLLDIPEEK